MTAKSPGRHSKFTQSLATKICVALMEGKSMRVICASPKMPNPATVYRWLAQGSKEGAAPEMALFCEQYARAREIQAHTFIDEILEIADDSRNDWMTRNGYRVPDPEAIHRSKLRVDARKWLASKLLPKVYGDRVTVGGERNAPLYHEHRLSQEQADAIMRAARAHGLERVVHIQAEEAS